MLEISDVKETAAEFQLAVMSLRQANIRPELEITEIPSPDRLAKHSLALAAQIGGGKNDLERGSGRFVLLNSDAPQDGWGGNFRIVCFAKSPLETDIGADEMITDVCWAWLIDALERRGAHYQAEAGTITRVISQGFGSIADQSDHAELELRASWSPTDSNFSAHLEAWQDLMCMMSGLPPEPGMSRI
ncbi:MAG: DUF3000 domain-containing protein [Actinomycetota bacterium]